MVRPPVCPQTPKSLSISRRRGLELGERTDTRCLLLCWAHLACAEPQLWNPGNPAVSMRLLVSSSQRGCLLYLNSLCWGCGAMAGYFL